MKQMPVEIYYPALAFVLWGLVLSLIPKAEIKRLFWLSLIWGYLGSKGFIIVFSGLLNLFQWKHAMPFVFLGAPHWLVLGWIFAIMLFLYFLPKTREWYVFALYVLAFSLSSAALDKIYNQAGLLEYIHWSPWYRFLIAMTWFYGAARHHDYLVAKGKL